MPHYPDDSLHTRIRSCLAAALRPHLQASFLELRLPLRFTLGQARRTLGLPNNKDPLRILRQSCESLSKTAASFALIVPPAQKRNELRLVLSLNPRCCWPQAILELTGLPEAARLVRDCASEHTPIAFAPPPTEGCATAHRLWREQVSHYLLTHAPRRGQTLVRLLRVHSHTGFARAFPGLSPDEIDDAGQELEQVFKSLRLAPDIKTHAQFSPLGGEFRIEVWPTSDWSQVRAQITARHRRLKEAIRSGLTREAAQLRDWIESLSPSEMLDNWTPYTEPAMATEMGFDASCWMEDEVSDYLDEVIAELNERTPYSLVRQRWELSDPPRSRIRVGKKPVTWDAGVRELERFMGTLRRGERAVLTLAIQPAATRRAQGRRPRPA